MGPESSAMRLSLLATSTLSASILPDDKNDIFGVALESFEGPNTAGHSVEELSIDDLFGDSLGGGKDVFYPLGTLMEMHEMGTDTSSFSEIPSSDEVKLRFFLELKI